jgi:hypothetical protein
MFTQEEAALLKRLLRLALWSVVGLIALAAVCVVYYELRHHRLPSHPAVTRAHAHVNAISGRPAASPG